MTDSSKRIRPGGWPLIDIAIEPLTEDHIHPLTVALARMAAEDPGLRSSFDPESGQILLHGDSELYLDELIGDLKARWGIGLRVGAPNVACREILTRKANVDYSHKMVAKAARQLPGVSVQVHPSKPVNQFARVVMAFEPGAPGSGFSFSSETVHGVPAAFVPGVVRGVETAMREGLKAGHPVIDVKATLIDGAYHDLDSSAMTFAIAARDAFKTLRDTGGVTVVEPVVAAEVITPVDCRDAIVADLTRRGGRDFSEAAHFDGVAVTALVRLEAMLGYGGALSRLSHGRARFAMAYDHYAPVPETLSPDGVFPPAVGMRA